MQADNQLIYKDSNVMRSSGLIFLALSPVFFLVYRMPFFASSAVVSFLVNIAGWIFISISLAMILFSSNLTIVADQNKRVLFLHYRWLLFGRAAAIPFDDIADIQAQAGVFTGRRTGYRLVAVLKSGIVLPLRRYFTRHDNKKQAASDLRFAVTGQRRSTVAHIQSAGRSLTI